MAPPAPVFHVEGCGDEHWNGGYAENGERDGKTCFRKVTATGFEDEVVQSSGSTAWVFSLGLSTTYYHAASSDPRPPCTMWQVLSEGVGPAPTIRYPTVKEREQAAAWANALKAAEEAEIARLEWEAKQAAKREAERLERERLAYEAEMARLAAEAEAARLAAIAAAEEAARQERAREVAAAAKIVADHNKRASKHAKERSKMASSFQTLSTTLSFGQS